MQYCPRDCPHWFALMTNDPNPVLPSSPGAEPFEGGRRHPGELALVGGSEWSEGCESFDQELLRASGTREILVLPTAAAYWHPERAVEAAASYFSEFGASVKGCMVLRRADAVIGLYVHGCCPFRCRPVHQAGRRPASCRIATR